MPDVYRSFGNLEFTLSTEPAIITNARKFAGGFSTDDDRALVYEIIKNRKVFDKLCNDDDGEYSHLADAIRDVVVDNMGLCEEEVKGALADYDKIMGIKPAKTETEIKIDKLQAELDSLRTTLRNA